MSEDIQLLADLDFDDLPEIVDDPNSPRCYERPIVLGPQHAAQLKAMMEREPPPWLKAILDRRKRSST